MASLAKLLLGYRHFLLACFLVCNAVIACVAVWYYTLPQTVGSDKQIGAYLIFVGVFGVACIIPLVAIDILRKHAVLSFVWFECLWVGIFWILELAGASALTATVSTLSCSRGDKACVAANVLLVFLWLCTVCLLVYVLALPLCAVLQEDRTVWHTQVRYYAWFTARQTLNSAPPSPTRQWQKPLHLAAPRPQHPPARHASLARAADRDLEAGVSVAQQLERGYVEPRPAPVPPMQQVSQQQPSLYPAHLRSHLPAQPSKSSASPPPLGDWPRSQTQHRRAPAQPQNATRVADSAVASSAPTRSSAESTVDPAGRPRPQHPRRGSNGSPSRQRPIPPPLDLTRISAYRTIDERVSRQ